MQSCKSAEVGFKQDIRHKTQDVKKEKESISSKSEALSSESASEGSVLTFGVFDGVHIAHQKVISCVVIRAKALGVEGVVVSFDPHPALPISGKSPPALTSTAQKIKLLESLGVSRVVMEDFSERLSRLLPEEFVKDVLLGKFHARAVVVGYDCAFGKDRAGDRWLLKELGEQYGFAVEIVEPYRLNGAIVSSTRIRAAILEGDLELAQKLLGRPYSLSGPVVQGKGIGRKIGYATANLRLEEQLLPSPGVYAVKARVNGHNFAGAMNMGKQPTFGGKEFRAEVHLLDFEGILYGKNVEVFFIRKIRDEKTFNNSAELADQIKKDEAVVRAIFQT